MYQKITKGLAQSLSSVNIVLAILLAAMGRADHAILQALIAGFLFYLGYVHEEPKEDRPSTDDKTKGN